MIPYHKRVYFIEQTLLYLVHTIDFYHPTRNYSVVVKRICRRRKETIDEMKKEKKNNEKQK